MKKLEKTINILLSIFIATLPWQTRLILRWGELGSGYSEYLRISLYASDIVLLLLLSLYIYWKFKGKYDEGRQSLEGNLRTGLFALIGIFEFFVFISIFWAPDKALAMYKYALIVGGIGLFWLVKEKFIRRIWIEIGLISAGLTQALFSIGQFLTQTSIHNKWLGLALHDPSLSGTSVVMDFMGNRFLRSYASFDHPNILGGFLAMIVVLCVVMLLREKVWDNKELKYFLISSLPILVAGLFYSFSRTAWLATAIAVVLILFFAAIKKNKSHVWKIFLSILLSSLTVVALGSIMVELVLTRVHIDNSIENRSVNERVLQYQEANRLIEKRPFAGVGIGNYISAIKNEGLQTGDWYDYQPVHNTFMLVWAELGIFGFMAILGLLYYLFSHRNKLAYQNSLLVVLLILLIFDHWLWSFHFGILFFWLILGTVAIRK